MTYEMFGYLLFHEEHGKKTGACAESLFRRRDPADFVSEPESAFRQLWRIGKFGVAHKLICNRL